MIRKLKQSNSNQAVVSNDSELDLSNNTESNDVKVAPDLKIPSKTILNNSNLSNLKGFTAVRKKIKNDALKKEFIIQISGVLDLFETSSNKYEHAIVEFVCSVAEDYFIHNRNMGDVKEDAVIQCVSKYFNYDTQLVKTIIQLVLPNVPKSNIFRRNKTRIYNFLFFLVEKFSSTL